MKLSKAIDQFYNLAKSAEIKFVFPSSHPKVKDGKDHFPLEDAGQARNALARASQYSAAPPWYDGDLKSLVESVARKVHHEFPSIEVSEKSHHPGKD